MIQIALYRMITICIDTNSLYERLMEQISVSCAYLVTAAVTVQMSEGPPLADVVSPALCHKYHSEQAAPAGK